MVAKLKIKVIAFSELSLIKKEKRENVLSSDSQAENVKKRTRLQRL